MNRSSAAEVVRIKAAAGTPCRAQPDESSARQGVDHRRPSGRGAEACSAGGVRLHRWRCGRGDQPASRPPGVSDAGILTFGAARLVRRRHVDHGPGRRLCSSVRICANGLTRLMHHAGECAVAVPPSGTPIHMRFRRWRPRRSRVLRRPRQCAEVVSTLRVEGPCRRRGIDDAGARGRIRSTDADRSTCPWPAIASAMSATASRYHRHSRSRLSPTSRRTLHGGRTCSRLRH